MNREHEDAWEEVSDALGRAPRESLMEAAERQRTTRSPVWRVVHAILNGAPGWPAVFRAAKAARRLRQREAAT